MAYRITAICDRCKKEETQENRYFIGKDQWRTVKFEVSQYDYKEYLFCHDCQMELGLIKPATEKPQKVETVADRLFDCIAEIVAETRE
jgi:hypothetical protein